MDRASELGSYSLATPARLLCRKPPPSLVFGVDPATLDMVEDNGSFASMQYRVPEILERAFLTLPILQSIAPVNVQDCWCPRSWCSYGRCCTIATASSKKESFVIQAPSLSSYQFVIDSIEARS